VVHSEGELYEGKHPNTIFVVKFANEIRGTSMRAQKYTRETINSLGVSDRGFPHFEIGDTVAVYVKVNEGSKKRTQIFEGDVIAMHNNGASSSFTVRKIAVNSISVERIFPYYSPIIEKMEVKRHGDVRRAKLFFLRERIGKAARVKEKVLTRKQREIKQTMHRKRTFLKPIEAVKTAEVAPEPTSVAAPEQEAKDTK
jgi:large subunit ribosomal protein L19